MITIDGQEILENTKIDENDVKDNQETLKNTKIDENKEEKRHNKQVLMKLSEILIEAVIAYISFLICNLKFFDKCLVYDNYYHKYVSKGGLCYISDFSLFILFFLVCIIIHDIFKLFKYEDDYKFFGKIDKFLQKVKEEIEKNEKEKINNPNSKHLKYNDKFADFLTNLSIIVIIMFFIILMVFLIYIFKRK